MGRRVFWTAVGAATLLAAGGWAFMQYPQSFASITSARQTNATPQAQPPRAGAGIAVETTPVSRDTVVEDIRAIGTLSPNESVVISAEISGRVARIGFREGEKVKAGDALIELDSTMLQAELDKVRSDLALAKANNERATTLSKQGITTTRARDEAEAAFQAAMSNIALAEARLQKSTLTAPFAGIVGLRTVSNGAYVTPGQRIVELVEVDPLKVDFRVPELFASQLRVDQTILVTADAVPDRTFEGKISAIDPIVDVNGRAIRLRAKVPNPDGVLSPGFFVRIRIIIDRRPEAILVPESAIFALNGKTLVYRVVNNRALQTEVVLGQRQPGLVEIRQGLSASDVVVRAGQQRLREGVNVRVVASEGGAT